jgi:1-acyl-sn-glycerol-3-phosphate acyltransferase
VSAHVEHATADGGGAVDRGVLPPPPGHRYGEEMTRGSRLFYEFMRLCVVWTIASLYFRVRRHGLERLPKDGPYILCPSHRSNFDTPVLAVLTSRRLRYMGKESMWRKPFGAWFLTSLGGFPVERGTADRSAIAACEEVLRRGEPLVMFPEGTRQHGPELGHFHDGPAYVSCRTGVPIVPIGIGGSERAQPSGSKMIRPSQLRLVVGEPIHPPVPPGGGRVPRRVVRELTEQVKDEVQRLFDEAERRNGHPHPPR